MLIAGNVKAFYNNMACLLDLFYQNQIVQVMKSRILSLIALVVIISFSSCVKNEYYTVEPDQPVPPTAPVYNYVFDDNFDNDINAWTFSDPNNAAFVSLVNSSLKYTYLPLDAGTNTVAINTGAKLHRNFLIQTSIKSDNAMGLCFGVSNVDYGYSFFIDNAGYFSVYKEGDAQTGVQTIMDWQASAAINIDGWNDIELEQVGNYWVGYINTVKVFELPAQYIDGNRIGYIVLDGTTGYADYMTVQW